MPRYHRVSSRESRKLQQLHAKIKRRYATHYFTLATDRFAAVVSRGACASEQGAIRASAVRIFMGQYQKCQVVDRFNGVTLYTVRVGAGGFRVEYGSGVDFKTYEAA